MSNKSVKQQLQKDKNSTYLNKNLLDKHWLRKKHRMGYLPKTNWYLHGTNKFKTN